MQPLRKILIFSKDRAMQLLALLESLESQCLDFEESIVTILYRTTSTQHQKQYIQIQKMFPSISFRREICLGMHLQNLATTDLSILQLLQLNKVLHNTWIFLFIKYYIQSTPNFYYAKIYINVEKYIM